MSGHPTVIRCQCGQPLGQLIAGVFVIRHRGREIVCEHVITVKCERCGHVTRFPALAA